MSRTKEEQKTFDLLFADVVIVKTQVDKIFIKLKMMKNNQLKNQDVLDFLEIHGK